MLVFKSIKVNYFVATVFIFIIIIASIFSPLFISKKNDVNIIGKVMYEEMQDDNIGYVFKLNTNEKLYILSKVLNDYFIPESKYTDLVNEKISGSNLPNPQTQYAIIKNNRGTSENEISSNQIYDKCMQEIKELQNLKFINHLGIDIKKDFYNGNLYSAFDVFEPQKNFSIWQLEYTGNVQPTKDKNILLDAYLDAETGKIYGFSVCVEQSWESMDIDNMAKIWCEYLEIGNPTPYIETENIFEITPFYKKYSIDGINGNTTIMTIGFYDNVNELFLKIF